jgi:hypothetical protein
LVLGHKIESLHGHGLDLLLSLRVEVLMIKKSHLMQIPSYIE